MSPKRIPVLGVLAIACLVASASTTAAQGHRGHSVIVRAPVVVGGYYSPYRLYDPWVGFGYQYPWGPYPYPYPYPVRYRVDPGAAMRIDVSPQNAEVYLDGYYAGIVDDFDGAFQRLRALPGQHELVLYLDGYRTVHQKLYLTPRNTLRLKYKMEPLAPGEQTEARPQPPLPPPLPSTGTQPMAPPAQGPPIGPPTGPGTRRPSQGPPPRNRSAYGTLVIRVQPADAEILIDGQTWHVAGPQDDQVAIEVFEGRHTIEVRKSGFVSYIADVQVRRGATLPLNINLRPQEDHG